MNLRYLHYLRLVIEHGSFAAAAQAGGVSQPAISHGMKQLQRQFDVPLFVASGRRLLPTEAALHAAQKERGPRRARRCHCGEEGAPVHRDTLRVGVTPSAALVCGPALHAGWCDGHPRRRLDLSSADEGRMLGGLQGGELDLVIAPLPRGHRAAGLRCVSRCTRSRRWLTPAAATLWPRRNRWSSCRWLPGPSWGRVVSGPVHVLQEAFAIRRMRPPRIAASCPDFASLLHLMAHSDLLGVLPHPALLDSAPKGQFVPLRLRETLPLYEMHLFTRTRSRRRVEVVMRRVAAGTVQRTLRRLLAVLEPPRLCTNHFGL
jgi:DNA-binding transcriptional LysR family regulator